MNRRNKMSLKCSLIGFIVMIQAVSAISMDHMSYSKIVLPSRILVVVKPVQVSYGREVTMAEYRWNYEPTNYLWTTEPHNPTE